ncbi:unnamed protein product [Phytophthora fragariaefolia]|uniref:Unnamed protein product n=1 Tax=Phytophthora fragariaefolia TaxID=1490495 RepID=A0A9W6XBR6_9STRA|nr:unnamed protein product [Phytophthora fragariaefolia]
MRFVTCFYLLITTGDSPAISIQFQASAPIVKLSLPHARHQSVTDLRRLVDQSVGNGEQITRTTPECDLVSVFHPLSSYRGGCLPDRWQVHFDLNVACWPQPNLLQGVLGEGSAGSSAATNTDNTPVVASVPLTEAPPATETSAPPTEKPLMTDTTDPPTTEQPTTEPPTIAPPTTDPPSKAPSPTSPPTKPPTSTAPPATEPPTTKPPTVGAPTTKPPTTEAPLTASPTTDPPATEPSTTKPPKTEPPTTEPPTTKAPLTGPPTTEPTTTEVPLTAPPTTDPPTTGPPATTPTPTPKNASTTAPTTSAPSTTALPTVTTTKPATTSVPMTITTAAPSATTTAPVTPAAAIVVEHYNSSTLPPEVDSSLLNGSKLVNVEVAETRVGGGTTYSYVIITKTGETVKTIVLSPSISSPIGSGEASTSSGSTLPNTSGSLKASSSLGVGAIVGIIGGVFVVMLVMFAFFVVQQRRTKDRPSNALLNEVLGLPVVGKQVRLLEHGRSMAETEYADGTRTTANSRSPGGSIPEGRRHRVTLWEDPVILASRIPFDRIERGIVIGHGAFGEVYRGHYRDQDVAIKTLIPEKRKDIAHIKAFFSEVRIMATMEHPNIVPFIGVAWESLSDLLCVTEFMPGGDLRSLLKGYLARDVPPGMDGTKMQIAYDMAFALTYLHSLEPVMMHRDLKSRNILLTESLHAKITDFGASRIRTDETMTSNVGSSLWMAPEVMMSRHYDEKADVFSLGVVISELDTHELPYSNTKYESGSGRRLPDAAVLQMVSMGKLRVSCSRFMDPEMAHLVEQCVSVYPDDRPTAAECDLAAVVVVLYLTLDWNSAPNWFVLHVSLAIILDRFDINYIAIAIEIAVGADAGGYVYLLESGCEPLRPSFPTADHADRDQEFNASISTNQRGESIKYRKGGLASPAFGKTCVGRWHRGRESKFKAVCKGCEPIRSIAHVPHGAALELRGRVPAAPRRRRIAAAAGRVPAQAERRQVEAQALEPALVRAGPRRRRAALLPPRVAPGGRAAALGRARRAAAAPGGRVARGAGRPAGGRAHALLLHGGGGRPEGGAALRRHERRVPPVDHGHLGHYQPRAASGEGRGQGGARQSRESGVVVLLGGGRAVPAALACQASEEGAGAGGRGERRAGGRNGCGAETSDGAGRWPSGGCNRFAVAQRGLTGANAAAVRLCRQQQGAADCAEPGDRFGRMLWIAAEVAAARRLTGLILYFGVLVLLRFGDASAWFLIALAANALCVWLLWFRQVEPRTKLALLRSPRRRLVAAVTAGGNLSPASSADSANGTEAPKEKPKPKRKASLSRDRASSNSVDDALPAKCATFSGEINGVKIAAGASLKMCATAPTEIVSGCWTQVDATRFNVRLGLILRVVLLLEPY